MQFILYEPPISSNIAEGLPDAGGAYPRAEDLGLTVDEARATYWWATEHGPASAPYWSAEDLEEGA